jgi:hypothetical protein
MRIFDLDLNHAHFFCPATGECILKEGEPINDEAQSLMGYWHSEVLDQPALMDSDLQEAWDAYLEKSLKEQQKEDDYDEFDAPGWQELEEFLKNHENRDWVVFCITTRDMASGQVMNTVRLVIDMSL